MSATNPNRSQIGRSGSMFNTPVFNGDPTVPSHSNGGNSRRGGGKPRDGVNQVRGNGTQHQTHHHTPHKQTLSSRSLATDNHCNRGGRSGGSGRGGRGGRNGQGQRAQSTMEELNTSHTQFNNKGDHSVGAQRSGPRIIGVNLRDSPNTYGRSSTIPPTGPSGGSRWLDGMSVAVQQRKNQGSNTPGYSVGIGPAGRQQQDVPSPKAAPTAPIIVKQGSTFSSGPSSSPSMPAGQSLGTGTAIEESNFIKSLANARRTDGGIESSRFYTSAASLTPASGDKGSEVASSTVSSTIINSHGSSGIPEGSPVILEVDPAKKLPTNCKFFKYKSGCRDGDYCRHFHPTQGWLSVNIELSKGYVESGEVRSPPQPKALTSEEIVAAKKNTEEMKRLGCIPLVTTIGTAEAEAREKADSLRLGMQHNKLKVAKKALLGEKVISWKLCHPEKAAKMDENAIRVCADAEDLESTEEDEADTSTLSAADLKRLNLRKAATARFEKLKEDQLKAKNVADTKLASKSPISTSATLSSDCSAPVKQSSTSIFSQSSALAPGSASKDSRSIFDGLASGRPVPDLGANIFGHLSAADIEEDTDDDNTDGEYEKLPKAQKKSAVARVKPLAKAKAAVVSKIKPISNACYASGIATKRAIESTSLFESPEPNGKPGFDGLVTPPMTPPSPSPGSCGRPVLFPTGSSKTGSGPQKSDDNSTSDICPISNGIANAEACSEGSSGLASGENLLLTKRQTDLLNTRGGLSSSMYSNPVPSAASVDAQPRGASQVCKFALAGKCRLGVKCRKKHPGLPEAATGNLVAVPVPTAPAPAVSTSAKKPCPNFLQKGTCKWQNDTCKRDHPTSSVELLPKVDALCNFWQEGYCKNADHCPYTHPPRFDVERRLAGFNSHIADNRAKIVEKAGKANVLSATGAEGTPNSQATTDTAVDVTIDVAVATSSATEEVISVLVEKENLASNNKPEEDKHKVISSDCGHEVPTEVPTPTAGSFVPCEPTHSGNSIPVAELLPLPLELTSVALEENGGSSAEVAVSIENEASTTGNDLVLAAPLLSVDPVPAAQLLSSSGPTSIIVEDNDDDSVGTSVPFENDITNTPSDASPVLAAILISVPDTTASEPKALTKVPTIEATPPAILANTADSSNQDTAIICRGTSTQHRSNSDAPTTKPQMLPAPSTDTGDMQKSACAPVSPITSSLTEVVLIPRPAPAVLSSSHIKATEASILIEKLPLSQSTSPTTETIEPVLVSIEAPVTSTPLEPLTSPEETEATTTRKLSSSVSLPTSDSAESLSYAATPVKLGTILSHGLIDSNNSANTAGSAEMSALRKIVESFAEDLAETKKKLVKSEEKLAENENEVARTKKEFSARLGIIEVEYQCQIKRLRAEITQRSPSKKQDTSNLQGKIVHDQERIRKDYTAANSGLCSCRHVVRKFKSKTAAEPGNVKVKDSPTDCKKIIARSAQISIRHLQQPSTDLPLPQSSNAMLQAGSADASVLQFFDDKVQATTTASAMLTHFSSNEIQVMVFVFALISHVSTTPTQATITTDALLSHFSRDQIQVMVFVFALISHVSTAQVVDTSIVPAGIEVKLAAPYKPADHLEWRVPFVDVKHTERPLPLFSSETWSVVFARSQSRPQSLVALSTPASQHSSDLDQLTEKLAALESVAPRRRWKARPGETAASRPHCSPYTVSEKGWKASSKAWSRKFQVLPSFPKETVAWQSSFPYPEVTKPGISIVQDEKLKPASSSAMSCAVGAGQDCKLGFATAAAVYA